MSDSARPQSFGRVEDDGTVYVITSAGERHVGQVPDVDPAEALAFFERRFASLETEVDLLIRRIESGAVVPDEARKSIKNLRASIVDANAVGDLESLVARLDAQEPVLQRLQEQRREQRAAQNEQTKAEKEKMIAQAEQIADSNDWRRGQERFRNLLDQWKALPRIDRTTDDALWERFASARSRYSRQRKAFLAQDNQRKAEARQVKEKIIARSEQIADSTDWSQTAAEFRSLMAEWKAAGGAGRSVDDKLWARFRGLQDRFFDARSAALAEEDKQYRANQEAKEQILTEAEEQILPVDDVKAARNAFRDFLTRYHEYGRVPRDAMRSLDNRLKAIEQAIAAAEEKEWRRTDPEARKRAADTVTMFTAQIDKLNVQLTDAEKAGDEKKAAQLRESIATYSEWLEQAQKALDDFSA